MKNGSKVHCLYEVEIFRRGRVEVRITQFLVYDFYGTLVEHLPKSSRKMKGVRYKKGQRKEVELVEQKMYLV